MMKPFRYPWHVSLLAVWFMSVGPTTAGAQLSCGRALSEDDLLTLLKSSVADSRLQQVVTDCGVDFRMTASVEDRLRRAGASPAVVALARVRQVQPAAPAASSAGPGVLSVAQDESSIELAIRDYLEQKGLRVTVGSLGSADAKDEYLRLDFAGETCPDYRVSIDTAVSARAGNTITERCVKITLLTSVKIANRDRERVLNAINEHHYGHWACRFRINVKDSELEGEAWVNIPGAAYPVPTELVLDALLRLASNWKVLHSKVAPIIGATGLDGM